MKMVPDDYYEEWSSCLDLLYQLYIARNKLNELEKIWPKVRNRIGGYYELV